MHKNVTISDCNFSTTGLYGVDNQAVNTGLIVTHSTFAGMFTAIIGAGTFAYNNISNIENGITCTGNDIIIQNNFIHDFLYNPATSHYDGVEINGDNARILIQYNTIENTQGQTSCVNLSNLSAIDSVTIDTNKLTGGSYPVYVDGHFGGGAITNTIVSNNLLGVGSTTGYVNFNSVSPSFFGNVDIATGAYLVGQSPVVIPGTAVFLPSAALSSDDTNTNISLRMICTLSHAITGPFRIILEASSTLAFVASHIGAGKGNGTASNTTATPFEVKFSGASGLTLPAGEYVASDLIDPGITTFAIGDKLIVIIDIPTGTAGQRLSSSNSNVTSFFAQPGASYNVAAPSGYTASANNNFSVKAIVI